MRAVRVRELIGPDGLEVVDVEAPEAGGQLLLDVHAAGISYPELLLSRGLYQLKPDPPFILGSEVAGVVRDAPSESRFSAGDRVVAFTMGAMAELAVATETMAFAIPETLDFAKGAALFMNYHTAHFGLERRAALKSGESLLVHGAAGGVGTAAIQVGKALGARVLAVVSTDEKEQVARDCGADEVVRSDADWTAAAREFGGDGVDVVYDPVGGERFSQSIRCLASEGRAVVIGFVEGSIPEIAVNRLLLRNVSVVGAAWGHFAFTRPAYLRAVADDLARMVAEGHVDPVIGGSYSMDDVAQALRDLDERRAIGKLVLDPHL
ncbi:MAG: NADPH:quinone oxidoreductase family protein [Thermoleophilaceae bacterium]|nr:NADPH:quinone oxidoreductase family protein [Thermoleophilaceae bacterium]